jgi:hypothetical protein
MFKFLVLCGTVTVAACAASLTPQKLEATVSTFHQLAPDSLSHKSVAIIPANDNQRTSLEFKTYADKLAARFQARGLTVVDDPHHADYVAFVRYAIDNGQVLSSTQSSPEYGWTGGNTTSYDGTVSSPGKMGSFSGTAYTEPTFGVVGSRVETVHTRLFTRRVEIDMFDRSAFDAGRTTKVFEERITSRGTCGAMPAIIDGLLDMAFTDFPGASGSTRNVSVPYKGCSAG